MLGVSKTGIRTCEIYSVATPPISVHCQGLHRNIEIGGAGGPACFSFNHACALLLLLAKFLPSSVTPPGVIPEVLHANVRAFTEICGWGMEHGNQNANAHGMAHPHSLFSNSVPVTTNKGI